mmetsp:Transcript_12681/g.14887  ORF Transcript_12681/g.14887 Transcript_12681/m.14887 type:complete len:82 (+) Transcript_12681:900-1145(+)
MREIVEYVLLQIKIKIGLLGNALNVRHPFMRLVGPGYALFVEIWFSFAQSVKIIFENCIVNAIPHGRSAITPSWNRMMRTS